MIRGSKIRMDNQCYCISTHEVTPEVSQPPKGYTWKHDTMWYKGLLFLVLNFDLKHTILIELHWYPLIGHLQFQKTYAYIRILLLGWHEKWYPYFCRRMWNLPKKQGWDSEYSWGIATISNTNQYLDRNFHGFYYWPSESM